MSAPPRGKIRWYRGTPAQQKRDRIQTLVSEREALGCAMVLLNRAGAKKNVNRWRGSEISKTCVRLYRVMMNLNIEIAKLQGRHDLAKELTSAARKMYRKARHVD